MAKRAIGIDITSHSIRAVQLAQKSGQLTVEKVFGASTRRNSDAPVDIIRRLTSHLGFDWRANIAVAMDPRAVFFKDFKFSTEQLEQFNTLETTLLNNSFPVDPADTVAQVCTIERLSRDDRLDRRKEAHFGFWGPLGRAAVDLTEPRPNGNKRYENGCPNPATSFPHISHNSKQMTGLRDHHCLAACTDLTKLRPRAVPVLPGSPAA